MGYIIAYLLLAVVVDLLIEMVHMDGNKDDYIWINRRLWSDTMFDCVSNVATAIISLPRQSNHMKQYRCRLR